MCFAIRKEEERAQFGKRGKTKKKEKFIEAKSELLGMKGIFRHTIFLPFLSRF